MFDAKKIRTELGMSQTEFADHFKIKIDTLRMWEQGVNRCPRHTQYMIMHIIELEELLTKEGRED